MATSITRPLGARAVHLRITPRPSSLGESREILRLISQFGEVEYFKSLKYDTLSAPNAALVIFKEEKAAEQCLWKSPIRFRMGRVSSTKDTEDGVVKHDGMQKGTSQTTTIKKGLPRGPVGAPFGLTAQTRSLSTSSLPDPPRNPIRMPFDPPPSPDPPNASDGSRIFQITTNPSRAHFREQINMSHYHGTFAIDSKMPGQEDLAKKMPVLGMSCVDWRRGERPWRVMEKERKRLGAKGRLGLLWKVDSDVKPSEGMNEDSAVKAANTRSGEKKEMGGDETFKPFEGAKTDEDEGTLTKIVKGWGLSPADEPRERYSGKLK